MNIIYYAHHINKYNTDEEIKEIELIKNHFKDCFIINPNGWIAQDNDEKSIMNQCFHFIKHNCNMTIFSTIENDIIGKGVYTEIKCTLDSDKTVYYLKDEIFNKFTYEDFNKIKIIYEETKSNRKYAKVIL